MGKIKSVLFVCTGNSCRSVMAEGLLEKRLKELGKDNITVRSAGVMALGGVAPTDETIKVMSDEGIDVSGHRTKGVTHDLIKNSDVILVMEKLHKDIISKDVPEAASKIYLLKEFGNPVKAKGHDKLGIRDPMGMPIDVYMDCLGEIKEEIERIAGLL